jgi:putative ABC transport system permease protein
LGATSGRILRAALQDAIGIVVCGAAAGVMVAGAAIRPLTGILPDGVNPWDPLAFGGVAALLICTGVAAAWLPARRAARVDPAIVLRQD